MSFLNSLLLTLIKALHTFINNYALTIIVFTILIKLVVMPLNLKSRRSTMRMSTIQPKAAALQAKYKDDQEKLNQKLQELYRKEGVNPMGSCLPMLISMVILFAMFYALRTFANEQLVSQFLTFYHTPFIDSATYAPYIAPVAGLGNLNILGLIRFSIYQEGNGWFLLPILSVVSQIFMQKLTMKSSPMDPSQAGSQKMMIYVMTFMSLYFCASYNSAFALYWVVSNIYAIVEQICFNKYFEQQDRKAAKAEEVGI